MKHNDWEEEEEEEEGETSSWQRRSRRRLTKASISNGFAVSKKERFYLVRITTC
jgi:hypothetical protein